MCSDGLSCTDDVCNEASETCENPTSICIASGDPCAMDICIESLNGCQFTCGATIDTWLDVKGISIVNLITTINSGVAPNMTERLGSLLESPHEFDADYGSRMMGWLVPPTSGEYIFWVAGPYPSQLWLSTDDNPENKILLVEPLLGAPAKREFSYNSQKSEPIELVADRAYYFEVRQVCADHILAHSHKSFNLTSPFSLSLPVLYRQFQSFVKVARERTLGLRFGYLSIAWQYPGHALEVIPANYSQMTRPTLSLPQL